MKGKEIPTNENYDLRAFVTECGRIEYGFYRVMFGIRFRAGYAGEGFLEVDWCCGVKPENLIMSLAVFEKMLSEHDDPKILFSKLPNCSKIKPFHNDPEFMEILRRLLEN